MAETPNKNEQAKLATEFVKNIKQENTGCATERLQPAIHAVTIQLGIIRDLNEKRTTIYRVDELDTKSHPTNDEGIRTHLQQLYDHTINTTKEDLEKFYSELFLKLAECKI